MAASDHRAEVSARIMARYLDFHCTEDTTHEASKNRAMLRYTDTSSRESDRSRTRLSEIPDPTLIIFIFCVACAVLSSRLGIMISQVS